MLEVYGSIGDHEAGVFMVPSPVDQRRLLVVASVGMGWDHVSVSAQHRIPVWREMDFIKRQFFRPDEVVMQLHVAEADHISCCNNCLHLWRPLDQPIPLPPKIMVA